MRNLQNQTTSPRVLDIELLALDLATCARCTGTDANLGSAISTVAQALREADVQVQVRKTVVKTEAQAEELRFESSPTIRINGRDIAVELRETNCGDCGDLCGCEGKIDCRVWIWRGQEHDEAPKALIVDAIFRAYGQAWEPAPHAAKPFRLPDNLRHFFESQAAAKQQAGSDCCDRSACCDETEKEQCCGVDSSHKMCGCES